MFGLTSRAQPTGEYPHTQALHLVGAVSALGPLIGGSLRDMLGSFSPTFQLFGLVAAGVFVASRFMRPPQMKREGEGLTAPAGLINDPV